MAGWLPLFLIQRLGISPDRALELLAVYWVALIAGRVASNSALPRISHATLLFSSAIVADFGSIVLAVTNNRFGGMAGVLLIGAAWTPIYPLVRAAGPSSLGAPASIWGLRAVMIVPVAGTIMVQLLVLGMWLETRWSAYHNKGRSASP